MNSLFDNVSSMMNLYHLGNMALSFSFLLSKVIGPLSKVIYGETNSELDNREHEILIFLAVVLAWKARKSTNYLHFFSTLYLCSKFVNVFLFFRANPLYGIIYLSIALVFTILISEPLQKDSLKIKYFEGNEFQLALESDKSITWIIEFFTTWNTQCRYIAPVFSTLSEKYTLPNLKFGKLDVGKYPTEGERFRINTHVQSKQIPSISIFRGGEQIDRRPLVEKARAIPFVFTMDNCINSFDLNNLYNECKGKLKKKQLEVKPHSE